MCLNCERKIWIHKNLVQTIENTGFFKRVTNATG